MLIRIQMFFHVSTTYCNLHKEEVREELYPPIADWKEVIQIAETMDAQQLQIISHKMMGPFPNTYTFSKNLGEHVVGNLCDGKIPAIILRPSIGKKVYTIKTRFATNVLQLFRRFAIRFLVGSIILTVQLVY